MSLKITFFWSVQVMPPFRDNGMRSTIVPDTIGTGILRVPAGSPTSVQGVWAVRLLLCYLSRILLSSRIRGVTRIPANYLSCGPPVTPFPRIVLISGGSPLASFLPLLFLGRPVPRRVACRRARAGALGGGCCHVLHRKTGPPG
jgi:hypothetical protein